MGESPREPGLVVYFARSGTAEDSDPSGWELAYTPDGRQVTRLFGRFDTEEEAKRERSRLLKDAFATPTPPDSEQEAGERPEALAVLFSLRDWCAEAAAEERKRGTERESGRAEAYKVVAGASAWDEADRLAATTSPPDQGSDVREALVYLMLALTNDGELDEAVASLAEARRIAHEWSGRNSDAAEILTTLNSVADLLDSLAEPVTQAHAALNATVKRRPHSKPDQGEGSDGDR